MNDYQEHQCLIREANELVQQKSNNHADPLYDLLARGFPLNRTPYVCCFSSEPDLLSQWRAYTGDGEGFAIGFSTGYLTQRIKQYCAPSKGSRLLLDQLEWLLLDKVEYCEEVQKKQLSGLLEGKWIEIQCPDDSVTEDQSVEIKALWMKASVWRYAAFCKNPAFRAESEWRIVAIPEILKGADGKSLHYPKSISSLGFRVREDAIVPFMQFDFAAEMEGSTAITTIGLGPKNYARGEDRDCLEAFLLQEGYEVAQIEIYCSNATCR